MNRSGQPFLPYGRHQIDDNDVAAVVAVLRGDWLTGGPAVGRFEQALAERVGAGAAVACNSGTAALHLAALALELGPGDAAVVPAVTFLATANIVRLVGAEVVFADVDPDTGLMGPGHLAEAIARAAQQQPESRVRAVFPVHLAGQCGDPAGIATVAAEHGLVVVEDACHALGTTYQADGQAVAVGAGRHSTMAAFSFHPVKTIAMGEGGAVTTHDDRLADRLRCLRSHGMIRQPDQFANRDLGFDGDARANPWYYEMAEVGLNYRASDLNCALGLSQLAKLDRFVARRRALVERYDRQLADLAPVVRPLGRTPGCQPAWHLYVVQIDFPALGLSRAEVMARLASGGIGSQVHYIPVPWQPYYQRLGTPQNWPGAAAYYAACLSLPLFPAMTDDDVDLVVARLADILFERAAARLTRYRSGGGPNQEIAQ